MPRLALHHAKLGGGAIVLGAVQHQYVARIDARVRLRRLRGDAGPAHRLDLDPAVREIQFSQRLADGGSTRRNQHRMQQP